MADYHPPPIGDGPQYFNNAHNLIIQNSTFGNITPNSALEQLGKHVMPGAEFDSSERDPPPRCHPGTRLSIVQRIRDWLQDINRPKNLLWLQGPAGVGKSAIIQTLAESESKSNGVSATLFFSALNGRNDPNRVFTTLAYQLAVQDPSYRAYVVELMLWDPRALDKAMNEQFRKLFIEPFTRRGIGGGSMPWLILLDGLDECRPPDTRSQSESKSERAQCEIIKLISTFVLEHPSVPLLWIISSRPESHLKAFFSRVDVHAAHWEEEVPIDSDEACQDVERYLRSEFENIRQQYPYHISSASPWPREEHFSTIARAALGHFVFAATVTKFIEDPDIGDPIAQLEQVLVIIDNPYMHVEGNPLTALDALYTSILQQINPTTLPLTKRLLAYYIYVYHNYTSLLTVACNILNIEQNRAYSALKKLYAVLDIPHPADVGERPLKFLHKSFVDYLRSRERSHNFLSSDGNMGEGLWLCSVRVLKQAVILHEPTPDISNISLCWCPLDKSAQVQLQWRVYATAACLFGDHISRIEEGVALDKIQSIDFSTIIGGHLILGMPSSIYSNFFLRFEHPHNPGYFTSHGLTRSINLGDVDVRYIRNDRLAHYTIYNLSLSGDYIRSHPVGSYFCHSDVLQAYRFDPEYVAELPDIDPRNPLSEVTGVSPPFSTLLDRLRLRQIQYPLAQATIIGASPSTSCVFFRCNYTSDGRFVDRDSVFSMLKSEPDGTKITEEIFVLPYFW
ncbi:hypothetical protein P691DRAFT_777432 [Macrolepiota fuliginosa MF-IS2]|uniref:NACHT domain-containing protein n=1 Tax=Macrolepiota fuliginosa MF-IS2 TaxID=1400762 RepID=A0A9P5X702_9AGAR|nr:hypothetical protein P691DRAFT_777432 [Macrolepiota fuliginosa MF-IS2]